MFAGEGRYVQVMVLSSFIADTLVVHGTGIQDPRLIIYVCPLIQIGDILKINLSLVVQFTERNMNLTLEHHLPNISHLNSRSSRKRMFPVLCVDQHDRVSSWCPLRTNVTLAGRTSTMDIYHLTVMIILQHLNTSVQMTMPSCWVGVDRRTTTANFSTLLKVDVVHYSVLLTQTAVN